ncbi:MAG: hypothetical protein J0I84_05160 [Terrimonas sp.]|nr:hypothetical protein [Terrimonas sp.]OJY97968.1 MAG: hypothetical protein BGP13_09900 [Sphingobacteriales bacterium 40-81]
MKNHLLKSHEPILDFAFRKMVYPTSVYSAIAQGKIKPDFIGTTRTVMIDLRKYGEYKFQVRNPDKTALIKWFLSTGFVIKKESTKNKLKAKFNISL